MNIEFFHANLRFQGEKKKKKGNFVFTTMVIHMYFVSLALVCKFLLIFLQISLETKMSPLISQMLAFLGTLFILTIKIMRESHVRNAITEQSHATRFKTADLDISGILCSTVVSKTIKCFTKFHLQIIEDINFDRQKNLHLLGTHFNR